MMKRLVLHAHTPVAKLQQQTVQSVPLLNMLKWISASFFPGSEDKSFATARGFTDVFAETSLLAALIIDTYQNVVE